MKIPQLRIASYMKDRDLPLALVRDRRRRGCPQHTHDFTELVIVTGGAGSHVTEKGIHPIGRGDVFVIEKTRVHGYEVCNELDLVNILWDWDRLQIPLKDLPTLPGYHALFILEPVYREDHGFPDRLRLDHAGLTRLEELVVRMEREIDERRPGFVFASTASLMQIVGWLSRCYPSARRVTGNPVMGVGRAMSHMEIHHATPLRLEDLATVAGMSESSFLRAFRRATGTSPIDHLIRLRVRKACDLLRTSEQSITRIAFRVGFQDSNYFARQFRRVMGTSPRAWRAEHRSPPLPG